MLPSVSMRATGMVGAVTAGAKTHVVRLAGEKVVQAGAGEEHRRVQWSEREPFSAREVDPTGLRRRRAASRAAGTKVEAEQK